MIRLSSIKLLTFPVPSAAVAAREARTHGVANWRPIEIFLYDWWPLARRRDLFRRLAAAKVELKAAQSDQSPNG